MRRLLLLSEASVTPEQAVRMKEQAEAMLGIEVVVITGIRQALIVEET